MTDALDDMVFEPHAGFGTKDPDGNPWPFGYLSDRPGRPVFELNAILEGDPSVLRDRVAEIVTACNGFDDACVALKRSEEVREELVRSLENIKQQLALGNILTAHAQLGIVLSKAKAQP